MKRVFAVLLLVALLVPFVAAQDDEVVLEWRTRPDNQAEIDVYNAASELIDAEFEGVTLVYQAGGSETSSYEDLLITELEAGTAPDVFWIPGTNVARFAEAGVILNLADLAAADEDFSIDVYYEGPMEFLTTSIVEGEDALWGVPRDVSAFAIYYNAELFDEAGLDYPGGEDWDWEAFAEATEEIASLGEEIDGFGSNSWWANWAYWINAAGGSMFNEDYTACGLNTEATVEALEFITGLYQQDLTVEWGTDVEPAFLAGNVGMYASGRWSTPGIIANADFEWNAAPLPVGPSGEPTNWLFWGAYVVNAGTEHPEEAFELLQRLTSPEIQGEIASLGANIPSRAGEEAIELFLNTLPDSGVNNEAFIAGTTATDVRAEAPLFFGNWPAIDIAYGNAVAQVFAGDLTPQEFADTICEEVAPEFDSASAE